MSWTKLPIEVKNMILEYVLNDIINTIASYDGGRSQFSSTKTTTRKRLSSITRAFEWQTYIRPMQRACDRAWELHSRMPANLRLDCPGEPEVQAWLMRALAEQMQFILSSIKARNGVSES